MSSDALVFNNILTVTPDAASFATPYSVGDVVGGVNEVASAISDSEVLFLDSVVVLDKTNQKSALDLIFFNANPANSIGADNAAYALNDADLTKVLGRVSVAGADYISSGTTNAEATKVGVGLALKAASGSSLFMAVISRGTPTYGSASDLIVKLGIRKV